MYLPLEIVGIHAQQNPKTGLAKSIGKESHEVMMYRCCHTPLSTYTGKGIYQILECKSANPSYPIASISHYSLLTDAEDPVNAEVDKLT